MENIKYTERTTGDHCKEFVFFVLKLLFLIIAFAFVYRYILVYHLEYSLAQNLFNVFSSIK